MEIAGEDGFRIRSYRNAASALEGYPERAADLLNTPGRSLTEIAGIGKGLAAVVGEIAARGLFGDSPGCSPREITIFAVFSPRRKKQFLRKPPSHPIYYQ